MLSSRANRQIIDIIEKECDELKSIRADVIKLIKDTILSIIEIKGTSDFTTNLLERFAAINYELSESIQANIRHGMIMASLGLLRWQIVIFQRCFVLYHDKETLIKWKNGNKLREQEIREYIRNFPLNNPVTIDDHGTTTLLRDDSAVDFDNLSKMFHLAYDKINVLYNICTHSEMDEKFKFFIKRFIFDEIRNSMRILSVFLDHLRSISGADYTQFNKLVTKYNMLDATCNMLILNYAKLEKEILNGD